MAGSDGLEVAARPAGWRLRSPRPWLSVAATASALLLLGPFYLWRTLVLALQSANGGSFSSPPMPMAVMVVMFCLDYYPNLFLGDLGRYLGVSVLGLLFGVAALTVHRPRPFAAGLVVVGLVGIVTFPLYYRYQPALAPAPGRQMLVATEVGPIEGVVRRAQLGAEVLPCQYALLGWSDAELYYRSTCGEATATWAWDPDDGRPRVVAAAPEGLAVEESQSAALAAVRYQTENPAYEANLRLGAIQGKVGLVSPDERWVAIASRHIYGPQDVLVVSQ